MLPVKQIRAVVGWTQSQLANAAGTSQPTIATYETGAKSPTWRTVTAVAEAAGVACYPSVGTVMTREDARSLALHLEIARSLHEHREAVLDRARRTIERMRRSNPHAHRLLDEWERVLEGSITAVVSQMLDPSEHGRELRQVSPFAGVLDARRRAAVYRTFREAS